MEGAQVLVVHAVRLPTSWEQRARESSRGRGSALRMLPKPRLPCPALEEVELSTHDRVIWPSSETVNNCVLHNHDCFML